MLVLFILVLLVSVLLSLPAVQTSIAKRITNDLNKSFGTSIQVERVGISLFTGRVSLRNVFIEDHHQDTLAHIDRLRTSLLSVKDAASGTLKFGNLFANKLNLIIRTYEGDSLSNLDFFVEQLDSGPSDPNAAPFYLSMEELRVEQSRFRMIDDNLESPVILDFSELSATAKDFLIFGPEVSAKIADVHFKTRDGFQVTHLETEFAYGLTGMDFGKLLLETPHSSLSGDLIFRYKREDFAEFTDKVQLVGNLVNSEVSASDLNRLYAAFGEEERIVVDTIHMEGTLNDLILTGVNMQAGGSRLRGDFELFNVFDSKLPLYIDARMDEFSTAAWRLEKFLPGVLQGTLPSVLDKLGDVNLSGTMGIGETALDANVSLQSTLGRARLDLVLDQIQNVREVSYSGLVRMTNFDLGALLDYNGLGATTLRMNVEGIGFEKASLNTEVIGNIDYITYNEYAYKDITVAGLIKDELFDGEVIARDPYFNLDFEGLADISGRSNRFNFRTAVREAHLNKINLFTRDSIAIFQGNITMDAEGTNLDNFEGEIRFLNTSFKNQNDAYYFEDFSISARFEEEERIIEFDSPDIITGYMRGKFLMDELDELVLNSLGSIYTNYEPLPLSEGQYLSFDMKVYNKIVDILVPELEFGPNTFLRGRMSADDGDFKLSFRSPHIEAYKNIFDQVNLNVDNKNPLFNTYVEVGKIQTEVYDIADFSLINTKIKDTLFFRTEFKGGDDFDDEYNLNFYHTFNDNGRSVIGLKRSELGIKGNRWMVNANNDRRNKVIFNKKLDSIAIEALVMNLGEETILLEGTLIDSTQKDIDLEFSKVDLNKITPDIDSLKLDGVVDGYLNILQRNNNYVPSSNVKISDFSVNDIKLGNLFLSLLGNENLTNFGVNAKIVDRSTEVVDILGDISYQDKSSSLNLAASLNTLNLEPFSALGADVISNIRGYVSGNARITGSLNDPRLNGALQLSDAGLAIPLLNLDVTFNPLAEVLLTDQAFTFNSITLTDTEYKTQALLDGSIGHTSFSDWYLDLDFKTLGEKFLVLNTTFKEGDLYYGTGFISGEASIYGKINEMLNIEVTGRTEKGTVFKIPISDETEIGDFSFINFIDKKDPNGNGLGRQLKDVQGVELAFDLDVTPNAEVEIVIDPSTGSSLKGTGAGNLLIEINTNGKFRMWGDFITVTGDYNFKYGSFIDKRFKVEPNGTIEWNGDPLKANMNIDARYSLFANPSVLLENNQYTRKIETDVIIHLSGELMKPDIDYEIRFPTASAVTNSELQYRLEDQATRELQAFSLLSQGGFINQVSLTQQAVTGNIVQTASNMFNEILNAGDGKFDVGVTYDIGERNPQQDFVADDRLGVTVSTQISDRILINGKVGVPVGGVTQSVVAGNVEMQILLNEDGSLSATIFNRENEITQFFAQQQGYTQGVGLSYQVEFNTFRELIQRLFRGKVETPQPQNKPATEPPSSSSVRTMGNGMVRLNPKSGG